MKWKWVRAEFAFQDDYTWDKKHISFSQSIISKNVYELDDLADYLFIRALLSEDENYAIIPMPGIFKKENKFYYVYDAHMGNLLTGFPTEQEAKKYVEQILKEE